MVEITYFQGSANSFPKYQNPRKQPTAFACKASHFAASKNSYVLTSSPAPKARRIETQTHCRHIAEFPRRHRNGVKTFVKGGGDGDTKDVVFIYWCLVYLEH